VAQKIYEFSEPIIVIGSVDEQPCLGCTCAYEGLYDCGFQRFAARKPIIVDDKHLFSSSKTNN
jgi:hypothetical protein